MKKLKKLLADFLKLSDQNLKLGWKIWWNRGGFMVKNMRIIFKIPVNSKLCSNWHLFRGDSQPEFFRYFVFFFMYFSRFATRSRILVNIKNFWKHWKVSNILNGIQLLKIRRNDQQEQTLLVRLSDTSHLISHLDRFSYRDSGLEINVQIFGHRKNWRRNNL